MTQPSPSEASPLRSTPTSFDHTPTLFLRFFPRSSPTSFVLLSFVSPPFARADAHPARPETPPNPALFPMHVGTRCMSSLSSPRAHAASRLPGVEKRTRGAGRVHELIAGPAGGEQRRGGRPISGGDPRQQRGRTPDSGRLASSAASLASARRFRSARQSSRRQLHAAVPLPRVGCWPWSAAACRVLKTSLGPASSMSMCVPARVECQEQTRAIKRPG